MIELDLDDLFEEQEEIEEAADIPEAEEVPERGEGDAAKEEGAKKVERKKKVTRPRIKLDGNRLCGPRGIAVIPSLFENIKFKGKTHEFEDLNKVMKIMEHWAHRMYPKMTFDDCLQQIEKLGSKRQVQTNVKKFRMDMLPIQEETSRKEDLIDDTDENMVDKDNTFDELMKDTRAQLANPPSPVFNSSVKTPDVEPLSAKVSVPNLNKSLELTEEQRARIEEKRRIAEERRKLLKEKALEAVKLQSQITEHPSGSSTNNDDSIDLNSEIEQQTKVTDNNIVADSSKKEELDAATQSNNVLNPFINRNSGKEDEIDIAPNNNELNCLITEHENPEDKMDIITSAALTSSVNENDQKEREMDVTTNNDTLIPSITVTKEKELDMIATTFINNEEMQVLEGNDKTEKLSISQSNHTDELEGNDLRSNE